MGLLTEGTPLRWDESLPFIEYVKQHGILQFINLYNKYQDRCCDDFKWGDELEYLLVKLPSDSRSAQLSLRAAQIQHDCTKHMQAVTNISDKDKATIHPEYGSFMIESTPFVPYGDDIASLLDVERNMFCRKLWIEQWLRSDEYLMPLSTFPMLGVDDGHNTNVGGSVSQSDFISDALINPHPRFATLTRNIRLRRGDKVEIYVPIYRDVFTPKHENAIFMDAMVFGMGCCCLQLTHQCKSMQEARNLYDQLAVLTPILMALTASTPFVKGKISDFDCRWSIIAQSVDDRQCVEKYLIQKSRYDTINNYLGLNEKFMAFADKYNDIDVEYDERAYEQLCEHGIDALLSKHVAHLFIRDPLVIYQDLIDSVDDETSSHHFETIQSSIWQNVRFKPPPSLTTDDIGWRVEFRSMEIQFTEFENAAFTIFVTLLAKAILYYDMNLYAPMSKVDINFHRAHRRDAVRREKFWWRACYASPMANNELNLAQLSIEEIICGHGKCLGLVNVVRKYVQDVVQLSTDSDSYRVIDEYLSLIEQRASGALLTPAQWLREFVDRHAEYKHDSALNASICRDIVEVVHGINHGHIEPHGLLPSDVDIQRRYYHSENGALKQRTDADDDSMENGVLTYDWPFDCGKKRPNHMDRMQVNQNWMLTATFPLACVAYLRRLCRLKV